MHAPVDLNKEKVRMRKEIKRAKVWVISKLVRQIRNLDAKKGSEIVIEKNKRRAQRILEELDIIKELKPDDVFKKLVNTSLDAKDTTKPQMTLQEHAMIHIGSVSFIKSKMKDIQSNVSAFHQLRTGKEMPLFDDKVHSTGPKTSDEQKSHQGTKVDGSPESPTDTSNIKLSHANRIPDNSFDETASTRSKDVITVNTKLLVCEDMSSDPIASNAFQSQTAVEEVTPEPDGQIAVVSKRNEAEKRLDFKEIVSRYDDITQVLTNIGDGFRSDDSCCGSDIELEDLIKPDRKHDSSSRVQDTFFLDAAGASDKKFLSGGKPETSHLSDDEELKLVKSCFIESLSNISHQRNKGKIRPGQRARRRQVTKNDQNFEGDDRNSKSGQMNVDKTLASKKDAISKQSAPRHPSWEASRKRKQEQGHFQEFKGKKVCFDDSD